PSSPFFLRTNLRPSCLPQRPTEHFSRFLKRYGCMAALGSSWVLPQCHCSGRQPRNARV
ncbi:hypothetical protein TorRG33x02_154220, partial [Trema orientale]